MPTQLLKDLRSRKSTASMVIGMALFAAGAMAWLSLVKAAPKPPKTVDDTAVSTDNFQRSLRNDTYRIVADNGAGRGEVIYFYKCWMCHNKYTTRTGGPYLQELYQHQNLASGDPVNDDTVSAKIKEGGPAMPAFRQSLSDPEIADLEAYFRSGKCCVEGENPPANPSYQAEKQKWPVQSGLSGGSTGIVRIKSGDSPEGVGVQLIAPNGVRTTVYTDADGKFEFPRMQAGSYTLRVPTPIPFKPYMRDSVRVDGSTNLGEIVLERISDSDNLPASAALESQLSGAEILWNLPGTGEEKATFQKNCSGCHSWQQVFRNRFDEHGWNLIADRMLHFAGTALANRRTPMSAPDPELKIIVKWLSSVRGPDSPADDAVRAFPRPRGESTRVIVTEYELPRQLLALHDAAADAQGNIWYTSHKTRYVGKLDPRTGIVTEYTIPLTPDGMPGTHHAFVDKSGIVWISEIWAHMLNRLDPRTGQVTQTNMNKGAGVNAGGFGNFAMDAGGFIWTTRASKVIKQDPATGDVVKEFPLQTTESYDKMISYDGKYWAGGGPPMWGNTLELLNMETGETLNLNTGSHMATAKRGGFDPFGNAWFGGGDGALIELNAKARRVEEFWPPIAPNPYTDFYEAMPDKNGEVWAGVLHGRQMVRFNPKTDRWIVYQMPEPYAYDRRTVIDASTHPVTVWYVDYNGYLVRVQPRD